MHEIKLLSLVIPAFKQERTIIEDVRKLEKKLSILPFDYELIIVVDGKLDKTFQKARKLEHKKVSVISYEKNFGKGYAVRTGMVKAKGDVVGFIDAGMDIDPEGISMLLNHMAWYNADIILGSKLHPVSQVNYPFVRKVLSWGYRTFTHLLFGFKVRDTQVGLKLFKKQVADDVFPRLLVKQFAFDVEILAVAYALGYKRIYEAPIRLKFKNQSSITSKSFWKVIYFMLWDTSAVFYRLKIKRYYQTMNKKQILLRRNNLSNASIR